MTADRPHSPPAARHSPLQAKDLETLPNPHPYRAYEVELACPEFTCLCPRTGQPDFATLRIVYVPGPRIVELKSLKLYLWSYRQEGHFHEDVVNLVLNDLVRALDPLRMEIEATFNVRGGITTTLRARHERGQTLATGDGS